MLHYCSPARLDGESDEEYEESLKKFSVSMNRIAVGSFAFLILGPIGIIAILAIFGVI